MTQEPSGVDPVPARQATVVVIGAGPAGLMAAESARAAGMAVEVFDAMPSVGRKFLMAGKGGLNLTHAEPLERMLTRFGAARPHLESMIRRFDAEALRAWASGLGISTFVGSSNRVFPTDFKAAPMLRAWLHRLREAGIRLHMRHRWTGWNADGTVQFQTAEGTRSVPADALILALGGGSWRRLGSDAAWVPLLEARGITVSPLRPSNCGFDVQWSQHFAGKFAGQPVKSIVASVEIDGRPPLHVKGEFVVTASGVEGGVIYTLSAPLRDEIVDHGAALLQLDLAPEHDERQLAFALAGPRRAESLSNFLRRGAGIEGVKAGLLREYLSPDGFNDGAQLAAAIKALPLHLVQPRPIDEAISTAGGVTFTALDSGLMSSTCPGVFCCGEMLDWEAPTGGYLLTACFATGKAAGEAAAAWLKRRVQASESSPA